jgi:hypothetical protein
MRNSIIALGTLAILAMIVPMLALPVFAADVVVGKPGGIGTDAPKVGAGDDGGSNVISHGSGGQHQNANGKNAPCNRGVCA